MNLNIELINACYVGNLDKVKSLVNFVLKNLGKDYVYIKKYLFKS